MRSDLRTHDRLQVGARTVARPGALFLLCWIASVSAAPGQTFSSGSDGTDGIYAPSGPAGTVITFDPTQFTGTRVAANIFNFTTITIPAGVTVRLSGNVINGPVLWLAQGNVNIQGTIDLSGTSGHRYTVNPFTRVPSVPGAGGYAGQVGGNAAQPPLPGDGPGGGATGTCTFTPYGRGGAFTGNQFLIPLVGGSGGGGFHRCGNSDFGTGGGAGGGALLIASSTQITIGSTGKISANGGDGADPAGTDGGGGAGGAIRLVSNTITGTGILTASGGCGINTGDAFYHGGRGRIRLEAYTISFSGALGSGGCFTGITGQSAPFPLLLATAGPPTARVISIAGVPINANPNTFPDTTINTTSAVPVVIQTHNIPTTATVNLTLLNENGVADTVIAAPPLGNCDQNNVCTTTVNVAFPFGASRGLTKVTWTQ
jgi:hypothetical protein